ncbi:MAG: rRNA maturation RNase YbeY [Cytophagales bacterium]|nr:rRNA maturation RNase YbeY [Cytophagales bacterium]
MKRIQFFYEEVYPRFSKQDLKKRLAFLLEEENIAEYNLRYIFCSDEYLRALHHKFSKKNTYTDTLSFDLSEEKLLEGEVYLSTDRIKENSKFYQVPLVQEIYRVAYHGTLHLCGYTDQTPRQRERMKKKENYYMMFHVEHFKSIRSPNP